MDWARRERSSQSLRASHGHEHDDGTDDGGKSFWFGLVGSGDDGG